METPTGALFAVACTRAGLVGVLFAMQASVYPAEAIASGLRTCHLSERALSGSNITTAVGTRSVSTTRGSVSCGSHAKTSFVF